ncbi:MAG TPA: hypothetical protein VN739_04385 [Nitrososphaerales archaeon]|nr:hypothetical protein [Nitrososphaerales archaeon]
MVEPKKSVISSARKKLLDRGYAEEVEYDAINIEPVLIYSKSDAKVMFLRHKWETSAQIALQSIPDQNELLGSEQGKLGSFLVTDEEGNKWLKFKLPEYEQKAFETLDSIKLKSS